MNRLTNETSPYLRQHADNPVDWYPSGEEALVRACAEEKADPALRRLRGLPLVPRDGVRVVRGRGDGGADERALRLRQGRPGGAAGRGRALHGGGRLADGAGRLADGGLPDPGRAPVLGRDVLPARAALRDAELHAGAARDRRGLPGAPRRPRAAGERARGGDPADERAASLD